MLILFINSAWDNFLALIKQPPGSTIFILFLSLGISLFSTGLNRLLIDPKRSLEKQEKIKEHKERKKEIEKLKEENPKKYEKELEKWQRQDKPIQEMQKKMSLERLKPSCVTFLPMIIFFYALRGFYSMQGLEKVIMLPVAIPPMNPWDLPMIGSMMWGYIEGSIPPSLGMINFTAWYFLCSFTCSTIIQKLLGMQAPGGGGFGDLFDQSRYDSYKK